MFLDLLFATNVSAPVESFNNENAVVPLGSVKLELFNPIDEPILICLPLALFIFILYVNVLF